MLLMSSAWVFCTVSASLLFNITQIISFLNFELYYILKNIMLISVNKTAFDLRCSIEPKLKSKTCQNKFNGVEKTREKL